MIGGFGVSSKLSWDVMGGVGYQLNNSLSIVGGYRALGVDYSHNGFEFDVTQQRPILGAIIRFEVIDIDDLLAFGIQNADYLTPAQAH